MSLIFPSDLGSNAKSLNYMKFQTYTLTGGVGSARTDRSYTMDGEPAFLPIPVEGIQDQYANNWGSENVSIAHMALGRAVAGTGAGINSASGLLDNLKRKMTEGTSGAGHHARDLADRVAAGWDSGNLSPVLESMGETLLKGASPLAVGAAVGSLGNAVVQSTGIAGFEETSIVYNGPQFRNFSFNFSLKPLTPTEQSAIEKIVEFFKLAAAPQEIDGTLYRIYSLPKVFGIEFHHKDGENNALPKLGKCALTNIGVKYGGDRFQTFATGHAPVQTDISLQFIELVLQTKNQMTFEKKIAAANSASAMAGVMQGEGVLSGVPVPSDALSVVKTVAAGGPSDSAANYAANARQERAERDVNV